MNVANMDLAMLAAIYERSGAHIELREGWLFTLLMWQIHAEELAEFIQRAHLRTNHGLGVRGQDDKRAA